MTNFEWRVKPRWIRGLFAVALLIQIVVMGMVNTGLIESPNLIPANNVLTSTILATISAYILYIQVIIQRRQASVEEKMLEYETKPVVDVIDKNFKNNDVEVMLSNYGNGVAVDLQLNCEIICDGVDWYEGILGQTPLKRKDGDEVLEDTSIRPQEGATQYKSESVIVGRRSGGELVESNFETIMSDLLEEENEEIRINLWVSGNSKVRNFDVKDQVCDQIVIKSSTEIPRPDLQTIHSFQEEV